MNPLICVYMAAVVTTLCGLAWMLASKACEVVSIRRWDEGIDS